MLLKNSERAPEDSVPVALLHYGDSSKFVRIWEDYEVTIANVRLAFGIPRTSGSISLQTSWLDICKGRAVTIDKGAYPLMWTFLDELAVLVDPQRRVEGSSPDKVDNAPESTIPTPPFHTPEPDEALITVSSSIPRDDVGPNELAVRAPGGERWEEQIWEEELAEDPTFRPEENTRFEVPAEDSEALPEPEIPAPRKFKATSVDSASSPTTHKDVFPRIKQEKIDQPISEDPPRRERSPKKDHQTLTTLDDPRFEITIVGPGNAYAQFKTRGKHQVRKVLAAACKTFEMDESRSELVLSLSVEDDEGEMQVHNFVCAPEETIQGSGVDAGSKLYLRPRAKNADAGSY